MESYSFPSNVLSKKGLTNFLMTFFPNQRVDLRCEQFLNLKVLEVLDKITALGCQFTKQRKGEILQEKDFRLLYYQNKKVIPKLNFFSRNLFKQKKKKKKKKKKLIF
jgi:hypothetical protein